MLLFTSLQKYTLPYNELTDTLPYNDLTDTLPYNELTDTKPRLIFKLLEDYVLNIRGQI